MRQLLVTIDGDTDEAERIAEHAVREQLLRLRRRGFAIRSWQTADPR